MIKQEFRDKIDKALEDTSVLNPQTSKDFIARKLLEAIVQAEGDLSKVDDILFAKFFLLARVDKE
jgi:hypothetical protein